VICALLYLINELIGVKLTALTKQQAHYLGVAVDGP